MVNKKYIKQLDKIYLKLENLDDSLNNLRDTLNVIVMGFGGILDAMDGDNERKT